MDVKKVTLVYFSPTGTTQKVLAGIAKGLAVDTVEEINLTLPADAQEAIQPFADELVLIGAPVYGGRLPVEAIQRFKKLQAKNTLAVPIVLYGNREFEDALLELKDLCVELGFVPLAGGAFIGEHSFSTAEKPIANGRPDDQDLQQATAFGAQIKAKIAALASPGSQVDLEIPGRFPYEGGARPMTVAPETNQEACTVCGICADVCPTAAISVDEAVATDAELCIRCCACIKSCPEDARYWDNEMMMKITHWLYENCSARKEPQLFGVAG